MARQHRALNSATCPYCGKQSFTGRKAAKTAMRRAHPNDKMSIYKCRSGPGGMTDRWHYGHLADPIKQGIVDRDTVYSGHYRSTTTDKKDILSMPTIAEMAHIKHLVQNREIPEPTAPALVQAQFAYHALAEHVKNPANGFERYKKDGIDGWIGPLALKPFVEDLIPAKADWDSHQKHSRTRAVSEMLNRHKVVICVDHSGKLQGVKPTYFVAADGSVLDRLVPGKAIEPLPAPETPIKNVKKSRSKAVGGAYTRGYEILHKSVDKILKNAYDNHGIAVLGHELYDLADFSGIEKSGREKPSQGGFYTWMRDRASRGEFSARMETETEFNARPSNGQGGRKTYYYAPAGVEVPSMNHGETLTVYLSEAFPLAATPKISEPAPEPAVTSEPVAKVETVVTPDPEPAIPAETPQRRRTNRGTVLDMIAVVQDMSADADPEDHETLRATIYHLSQAVAVLSKGAVQRG